MNKTLVLVAFWLLAFLFMAFLHSDLVPDYYWHYYPKVAFGIYLYGPEAIAIIFLGVLGVVLTYVKISIIFHTKPKLWQPIIFLLVVFLMFAFLSLGVW